MFVAKFLKWDFAFRFLSKLQQTIRFHQFFVALFLNTDF